MFRPWFNLTMLGLEAQQVIWLRMMRLAAGGPSATREATLMVSEKVAAASNAGTQLMFGASQDSIVKGYRRKVRANARRLTR